MAAVCMNDSGSNFADETVEMVSENANNASAELRKRRSTRIVQAVPLVVTGVDALGRPFVERTSSLIINCHGCRYQSKHYVLKNMWVTMEIPHAETGQPPRTVRGRVAWIQRPRTVRQLFQVALELEISGNVWGIGFPPEDWTAFPEAGQFVMKLDAAQAPESSPPHVEESEAVPHLNEADVLPGSEADNLRVFPTPSSATDASLQLARQVARLVADAKQQIQAATREAASQAVSAERRLSFEQWEQKFAAGRAEIQNETTQAIEKFQQEADEHARTAHAAAAEALRTELPRWLAPQLEQLTRDLTESLSREGAAQRGEHVQRLENSSDALRAASQEAEETAARLKAQAEQLEAKIVARAESATQALEETAKQTEETASTQLEALLAAAQEIQQQVTAALASAQSSVHGQLASELEAAQTRWRAAIESTLAEAQDRAAGGLNEHARGWMDQLQDEIARHAKAARESATNAALEAEQRLTALRDSLQEQTQRLESVLAVAAETGQRLEQHSAQLENAHQQALSGFQANLENVLNPHREELHRRSEAIAEELNSKIRATFDEASRQAVSQFEQQIKEVVQPQVTSAEEAVHRLAGSRSLLDAALTMQQDRIRNTADEAFAESLARFRENLGSIEQILQDSSQSITYRNLTELEGKAGDLKHQMVEELHKSAEWYEKKAQTQIQNFTERAVEHAENQLREKAGEVSAVFTSELDHSSRSFVGHAQTQMEELVRDSFTRARALFAEAADTTVAAFTDEIQRTGREELKGYNEEVRRSTAGARQQLDAARMEFAQQTTAEQEAFLRRFQSSMSGALDAGVAEAQKKVSEGFGPLLESWKAMTIAHQQEMRGIYDKMGEQAAEQYKGRLDNVSNQWMLATVASLDNRSREMISRIAANAELKLREACGQVFEGVGESLRERLREMAQNFTLPTEPGRAKSATMGS
jgi:vacuolar-type H+-ATPase subunit E/Vma4